MVAWKTLFSYCLSMVFLGRRNNNQPSPNQWKLATFCSDSACPLQLPLVLSLSPAWHPPPPRRDEWQVLCTLAQSSDYPATSAPLPDVAGGGIFIYASLTEGTNPKLHLPSHPLVTVVGSEPRSRWKVRFLFSHVFRPVARFTSRRRLQNNNILWTNLGLAS